MEFVPNKISLTIDTFIPSPTLFNTPSNKYGNAWGIITLKIDLALWYPSNLNDILTDSGIFVIPVTNDSYNIGKTMIDVIIIEPVFGSLSIYKKIKKTIHGVGINFSTSISGFKKYLNLLFNPLIRPKISAKINETNNAPNVLPNDSKKPSQTLPSISKFPNVRNNVGISGNNELELTHKAIISQIKKMNKTPSDSYKTLLFVSVSWIFFIFFYKLLF